MLRRQRDQADFARLWLANRRARRRASRDCPEGGIAGVGAGSGFRPDAALPDRRLGSTGRDEAPDDIADVKALAEIGWSKFRFFGPPLLDQLRPEDTRHEAAG